MDDKVFKIPVLFLMFNRPDTTQLVFNKIRGVKPKLLFIAADGPRENKPNEHEKCRAARDILNQVDWDCKLHTLFRDKNLGCKIAVSDAITWFFYHVEAGIILEDDCLPNQSFFFFCEELLQRYMNDERIMMISGDNFLFGTKRGSYSYYFSRYCHIWGWATWRRAWELYDVDIKLWPTIKENKILSDIYKMDKLVNYWSNYFELIYQNKIDSWDYQWFFACLMNSALSIVPNVNLISNIGFNHDATHTRGESKYANLESQEISFPIKHPPFLVRDFILDSKEEKDMYISQISRNRLKKLGQLKPFLSELFLRNG